MKWRVWILDRFCFRHGLTLECSEDKLMDFVKMLGESGCVVESALPWTDTL